MTVFQRRNNIVISTLTQRQNLTLKQRCFWVDTGKLFTPILWCSKNYSLYINAVKITVFQRRNNVIWSTLYQRRNFTSKQRWFWVETKNNFVLMLWSLRDCNFFIDVEKITVFQRWNNVILSTLNQRRNLTLKQRWFWVDTKNFLLLLYYDVQGIIIFIFMSKWYLSFNIETTSLCQRQFNVKILRWSNVDFGLALQTILFLYVMILEGL